jgi:hypothetical protein
MRLEPDPLDPVGTGLKTGDVNPEVRDMMFPSTRCRVWNPDVVVSPSELRCHGRQLMAQSLSASHASFHRDFTHRLRSFGLSCARHLSGPERRLLVTERQAIAEEGMKHQSRDDDTANARSDVERVEDIRAKGTQKLIQQ